MRVGHLFVAIAMTGALPGETPAPTIKAPRILERVEPQYTNEARAARIEGTVTLRFGRERAPLVVHGVQRLRAWAG